MATQFTPCPACGAVGEVGSTCQFCGTTIILKEGVTFSDARIIKQRTITPQQYAEKISIYHNIEGLCDGVSKVSIGEQEGIVNLNGDLVYPLGNERISKGFKDGVVKIGKKYLNLETFEYVKAPYNNDIILEKIEKLSNEIINNPRLSALNCVGIGFCEEHEGLSIVNAWDEYNTREIQPQLMIYFNQEYSEDSIFAPIFKRFVSCDDFKLFYTESEKYENGDIIPPQNRYYYVLCGHDVEYCCRIFLRVAEQVFDIDPYNADEYMECEGDIFKKDDYVNIGNSNNTNYSSNINNSNYTNDSSNISNSSNTNTSNSGCAGMLALILGVGGAGIYGLVELISKLIA